MIADRQNGRILIVDPAGVVRWRFPVAGSLPAGQRFAADDAFLSPDGKTIVANEEGHEVIVRISIATRKVVWEYGRYNVAGSGAGELHTPDDAYPLANGDVIVADIFNCRVIEISPAKHIVHQWGRTGTCTDHAPTTYGEPNGDTPLPDGGLLITEIKGSRVVRLDAAGKVVFDIHVPTRYPSDAQLDANGNILVVDYSNPGAVLRIDPHGKVLWRYAPKAGVGRLNHPSLAVELSNGLVALNDDFRHRVIVIDPTTDKIVWQYGQTDHNGSAKSYLFTPDGIDEVPPSVAAGL
jgi:DNA-binding beta-propeller fold protein YncE